MAARLPTPGERFADRFVVGPEIGRGGFGVVFRATHARTGHDCALKVLTVEALFDDDARARFLDEARRTPSDRSPHVVRVLDADVTDGVPWLSMELLDGETLGAAVRARGPLSRSDFARFFAELCDGVGAAHDLGVVHRDLKPENVFLHRPRGAPRWTVKVLDFGVAKQLDPRRGHGTASVAVRTDGWGAPEQSVLGRISPSADVWSLGLVAYFALCGKGFFDAVDVGETVAPASARARSQGVAHLLPPRFDAWFAQCVAWDPSRRFADARAALAAFPNESGASPRSRLPRAAAILALVAGGTLSVDWALGRRAAPGAVAEATTRSDDAVVRAWHSAMTARTMSVADAEGFYAPQVRFNGQEPVSPAEIAGFRGRQFAQAWSLTLDDPGAIVLRDAAPEASSAATCGLGPLRVARFPVTLRDPMAAGNLPCREVRADYFVKLRETSAGWRICHESFVRESLCAACPAADGCALP